MPEKRQRGTETHTDTHTYSHTLTRMGLFEMQLLSFKMEMENGTS